MATTGEGKSETLGKYREVNLLSSSLAASIENDLTNLLAGDVQATKNLVDMNLLLFEKIVALEANAKITSVSHQRMCDRMDQLERENSYLRQEFSDLEFKLATVEDLTKRTNLRVEGLPEEQNEILKTTISSYFAKTGIACVPADIDYASRVGKFKEGRTRPVLVRMNREGQRNAILFNRNKINRDSNVTVWLNDDVSDLTRRHRKNVRDVASLAKLNGMTNIKTHSDGLVIDNMKYRFPDFDLLPDSLQLDKAKNRDDGEDVFFQGEYSPLSNFFPAKITDSTGMVYESAEQAFQYRKAKAHGSHSLANKIISTRSPYKAKKLGNKVQTKKAWIQKENDVMSDILLAKFTQNKNIGKYLTSLVGRQFHEATSDRKWAVGVDLSSKALSSEDWKGNDVLGQLLEATRDTLIATSGGRGGDSLTPSQSLNMGSDQLDGQYTPMSDDDLSDYEECIQSEDEAHLLEVTSQPDIDASMNTPVTPSANSSVVSPSGTDQQKSRNPYRVPTTQKSPAKEKTDSSADIQPRLSQAVPTANEANISTRAQRTRRKKRKSQTKEQLSLTIPKQVF